MLPVLALIGIGTTAAADWEYMGDAATGRHAAFVCDDGFCFGLSCNADTPLAFGISAPEAPDLRNKTEVFVQAFAGPRTLEPMRFASIGAGTFEAPFEEGHVEGLERLKNAATLELRYWPDAESPPELRRLSLRGSRAAIEAVSAACPLPDFEARALQNLRLADPAAQIAANFGAACGALGGRVTVQPGFSEPFDIDGVAPMDLRVNHGRLTCSAQDDMVCGPAGCLTSLWQADEAGYKQIFLNAIQDAAPEAPGQVRLTLKGSLCGRVGAGACEQVWQLVDGSLSPDAP
jgi:hypothetical protein